MSQAKLFVIVTRDNASTNDVRTVVEQTRDLGAIVTHVPTSTEEWPRDHLPRTLFAPPQFGNASAILECWTSTDAGAAFSALSESTAAADLGPLAGYVVEEHLVLDGRDSGPDALKMISIGRRNPQLSSAAAALHWRHVHAPLAVRHHVGMSRYVQNIVMQRLGAASRDVDFIAELSFDSTADFVDRFYDSPEGRRIIAADAIKFAGGGDTHFCVELADESRGCLIVPQLDDVIQQEG